MKKDLAAVRVVVSGGGAAGTAIVTLLIAAGVTDVVVVRPRRRALGRRRHALAGAPRAGRRHQPAPGDAATCTPCSPAPTSSSASARPACSKPEWIQEMAAGRGGLRARQPRPRGRPGRGGQVRRGRGERPLGLPEPDQQRAGLPRRLPRPARRPRVPGHHRHAAARGRGDRARGQGRRAQPELHHPDASSTPTCRRRSPPRSRGG